MALDRSRVARFVQRNLQDLTKGAGWSTASRTDGADTLTEGDYTDSIDTALITLGYIDEDGLPDSTIVEDTEFLTIAKFVEDDVLDRLSKYYATVVDTVGGPIRVYRSQVAKALNERVQSTGRKLQLTPLTSRSMESILE